MDFVIALQGQILPIEVKASATGSMKSLHQFMGEKGGDLAIRFDASLPGDFEVDTTIRKRLAFMRGRVSTLPDMFVASST